MNSEQYIAGAILISGEQVLGAIRGLVTAECFRLESCRAIFTAGESLLEQGQPIDPVSVAAEARRQGVELPNSLLAELMEIVPTAANCVDYAHRVAEDARKRRIKELAGRIQSDTVSTSDELLAAMQREAQVIQGSSFQRGLLSPNDTLRRFMDYVVNAGKNRDNFLSSGFPGLDRLLGGGFIRGGLYILGARPAVGKTTFALNLADNMAGNTLLVSLEMSPEQLTAKRVSGLTGYPAARLLSGDLEDEDRVWEAVAMAATVLGQKGVYVNNRYDLTVQQIHLLAQSVPQLRCVILDYLGLIQPANRTGSTYEQVSQTSRELKRMAISLNVPVVCLCQLSRKIEDRQDKKPQLSDLRDRGAIEQDADGVLFLYREDYYTGPRAKGAPSDVTLTVAKNRHGRTGEDSFRFWLDTGTFRETPA